MRLVIQRVKYSKLFINNELRSQIDNGLVVLIGIEEADLHEDVLWCASKLCQMRIFSDIEGKMNLDIKQVNGEILLISQFTLHASTKKGNRPSYLKAARPDFAIHLYEAFINETGLLVGKPCKTGVFGANMQVELLNDGPVTITIDSKNKE